MKISVGFSPCPNDTFIFYALLNHKFNTGDLEFEPVIEDVEELNRRALRGEIAVTKLSFALFSQVESTYQLLNSGSALGNNCGPLLISKRAISEHEIAQCTVAIPGIHTTANFLFSFFYPVVKQKREMLFSKIENALLNEETDLGVIIHENRFTYQKKGLKKVADLGELWERKTNLPIPLGGIFAKKNLGEETIATIDHLIHESILYAFANPLEAIEYVKQYSQEMEEEVMWQHIRLYVNDFTVSLGDKGHAAVEKFLELAELKDIPRAT
ncbi:MAG TPA: 1,4-dihydroxy-6-naphthoate synthase [Chitinophagales bacterium]|nr:1,4-dihydroxy-6-naphthoate synthase [Chitinophagales bacterium]